MIAKLFSEPLPAQKLHSWIETALLFFFSPLFVVLTISAVFVLQIEQTCEGLWLRCCFYSPLCCSVPPPPTPPSSFTSTPSIYFVWFNKPYSPDVRQSRSGVSWGRPFLKICVLCLDSLKLQHLLHPETTVVVFIKKKNTKIEYWAQICIFTVASGFLLLFGATGKLLPPTRFSTAVQSLQPFPDITQDFRQTPHLAIFSWWVHVSDSRTPAFQLCVLRWNGLCKGAPAGPNLRQGAGGF